MSNNNVMIRFKELLQQDEKFCSQQEVNEYLAYGLLFNTDKNKYVTRDNKPINIKIVKPNTFNIDLTGVIQQGEKLAKENKVNRIYFISNKSYDEYKEKGFIITKHGKDFYRMFNNEEWLVALINTK